jgi:C_GCAxxG_C_C family probable redox protein
MKTFVDASCTHQDWMVKLMSGMPGGIGNTGHECGAFTSPLVLLGLRYGLGSVDRGLPLIFYKGSRLCERFLTCNHHLNCKEIQGGARVPLTCINVVRHSPELLIETINNDCKDALPKDRREAYACLYAHMSGKCFHCAQTVFTNLQDTLPVNQELLDAVSGFLGGTLFQGRTCSAFTAGVMAVGLKLGEIENSFPRVARMLAIMAKGGNAFGDDLNKFHMMMNTGYRMSKWFRKEFGSIQCCEITHCDFSTAEGVQNYIDSDCITKCQVITQKVAEKVIKSLND